MPPPPLCRWLDTLCEQQRLDELRACDDLQAVDELLKRWCRGGYLRALGERVAPQLPQAQAMVVGDGGPPGIYKTSTGFLLQARLPIDDQGDLNPLVGASQLQSLLPAWGPAAVLGPAWGCAAEPAMEWSAPPCRPKPAFSTLPTA